MVLTRDREVLWGWSNYPGIVKSHRGNRDRRNEASHWWLQPPDRDVSSTTIESTWGSAQDKCILSTIVCTRGSQNKLGWYLDEVSRVAPKTLVG